MLDATSGAKLLSCLDLQIWYWQVKVDEKNKERTVFAMSPLFFLVQCHAIWLNNTTATFQRFTETCLEDLLLEKCLVYINNIVVFSSMFDDHHLDLRVVFEKLKD